LPLVSATGPEKDTTAFQREHPRRDFKKADILLGDQKRKPPGAQFAQDTDFLDEQRDSLADGSSIMSKRGSAASRFCDARHLALIAGET